MSTHLQRAINFILKSISGQVSCSVCFSSWRAGLAQRLLSQAIWGDPHFHVCSWPQWRSQWLVLEEWPQFWLQGFYPAVCHIGHSNTIPSGEIPNSQLSINVQLSRQHWHCWLPFLVVHKQGASRRSSDLHYLKTWILSNFILETE